MSKARTRAIGTGAGGTRGFGKRMHAADRAEGLAYARAWRIRMKPHFDAIYGPETVSRPCPACGQSRVVLRG